MSNSERVASIPTEVSKVSTDLPIWLYLPNIIGYIRIFLGFASFSYCLSDAQKSINLYVSSALLDLIDGPIARKFNQCSRFGIMVDILADNVLRTLSWIQAIIVASNQGFLWLSLIGCFIICIEWLTMHALLVTKQLKSSPTRENMHWKDKRISSQSSGILGILKRQFFKNNFKNPIGILGMFGLFGSSILAYCHFLNPIESSKLTLFGIPVSSDIRETMLFMTCLGRILTLFIELDAISEFFSVLLEE